MADPNAVQNLCDALKAFALPPATAHNGYAFAKVFRFFLPLLLRAALPPQLLLLPIALRI
jgi:hypothetical protein